MQRLLFVFISIFVISCTLNNQASDLENKLTMPNQDKWESINFHSSTKSDIISNWWNIFEDPILDSTMNVFLNKNYDLKLALYSLESANALSKINNANFLPDISFSLNNSRSEQNFSGSAFEGAAEAFNPSGGGVFSNTYGLNISTQWEIDVWGKIINSRYANKKDIIANFNDYEYAKFSLTTHAVKMYFTLVEASEQVSLAKYSVEAYNETYRLVEERYNQGVANSLDYRLSFSNLLIAVSDKVVRSSFFIN